MVQANSVAASVSTSIGLMAVPNLVVLLSLNPLIFAMTKEHEQKEKNFSIVFREKCLT